MNDHPEKRRLIFNDLQNGVHAIQTAVIVTGHP
jgi:hypothetical protein